MAILCEFISALFWGGISGLIASIAISLIMKRLFPVSKLYVIAVSVFLFLFLSFQFTTLIAAVKTKNYIKSAEMLVQTIDNETNWTDIETTYPILKPYIGEVKGRLKLDTSYPMSVAAYVTGVINGYLWRRVAWIWGGILFVFISGALLKAIQKPTARRLEGKSRERKAFSRPRNTQVKRRY